MKRGLIALAAAFGIALLLAGAADAFATTWDVVTSPTEWYGSRNAATSLKKDGNVWSYKGASMDSGTYWLTMTVSVTDASAGDTLLSESFFGNGKSDDEVASESLTLAKDGTQTLTLTYEMPAFTGGQHKYTFDTYGTFASSDAKWRIESATVSDTAPAKTPVPGAVWLLGTGLVGLLGIGGVRVRRGKEC